MTHYQKHVFICTNQKMAGKTCCANTGGETFFDYLKGRLLELELHGPGKIRVSKSGCLGRCSLGPSMVVYPEGVWYRYATFEDLDEIISNHLLQNQIVTSLLMDK
ncbi:MAG: (2Fe-2S) ferredoxin domain-containing protein [Silvanigrellaceae bacterium]|nr:(2Fe-2S) ferredoxin domain-containing protein [Silvanigrellaceae bacterium]